MTENQRLAEGQNPKTLLPLRYVPPIASEHWRSQNSVVRGINAPSGEPPADVDLEQSSAIMVTSRELASFPQLLYMPGYEGATHLSNNGLVDSGGFCGSTTCRFPVTSKEERRGASDEAILLTPNTFGPHSIYDPRHYGFADRPGIVNQSLGRVEYDYRDIDRIRIPHFLTRNQLDQTVIDSESMEGNVNVNLFAIQNYTDSVINQRVQLQNAWLDRRESDRLQRKLYPINTNGQYTSKG
jgi:hypothetical protein